jgi:hypothetical protein
VGESEDARVAAGYRLVPWSQAQRPYTEQSLALARWVLHHAPTAGSRTDPVGVPSRVLEGLEMPGIEILVSGGVAERGPWRFWRERFAGSIVRALASFAGREPERRAERSSGGSRRFW